MANQKGLELKLAPKKSLSYDLLVELSWVLDLTRHDAVWSETPLRLIPPLYTSGGREKSANTQVKVEVAQPALTVPGVSATRLLEAARAWTERAPADPAAAAVWTPSDPFGDDEDEEEDEEVPRGSAQRPRRIAKQKRNRWEIDWSIYSGYNYTMKDSFPAKPRVQGFHHDDVSLDGESIKTNFIMDPELGKCGWAPVVETGSCCGPGRVVSCWCSMEGLGQRRGHRRSVVCAAGRPRCGVRGRARAEFLVDRDHEFSRPSRDAQTVAAGRPRATGKRSTHSHKLWIQDA
jgi:hypothetical protein